jgi:hypothetical protein
MRPLLLSLLVLVGCGKQLPPFTPDLTPAKTSCVYEGVSIDIEAGGDCGCYGAKVYEAHQFLVDRGIAGPTDLKGLYIYFADTDPLSEAEAGTDKVHGYYIPDWDELVVGKDAHALAHELLHRYNAIHRYADDQEEAHHEHWLERGYYFWTLQYYVFEPGVRDCR